MQNLNNLFNDLEDEERIVIYALGALHNTLIRSKIKIQKLLFLISNALKERYGDLFEFEPHLFGPYSEKLDNTLQNLQKLGLIEIEDYKYKLTQKGLDLYRCLKLKCEVKIIEDLKEFLNDLTDDEILTFIYVSYPKYIGESAKWDELKKDRVRIAVSLLKKEKISFGKAVEISGLTSQEFENLLKEKGIKWKKHSPALVEHDH